jgi:hypothetical protein
MPQGKAKGQVLSQKGQGVSLTAASLDGLATEGIVETTPEVEAKGRTDSSKSERNIGKGQCTVLFKTLAHLLDLLTDRVHHQSPDLFNRK